MLRVAIFSGSSMGALCFLAFLFALSPDNSSAWLLGPCLLSSYILALLAFYSVAISMTGFVQLIFHDSRFEDSKDSAASQITSKLAIVVPVRNEDPSRVFAGLLAMWEDISRTQLADHVTIFLLSDSTDDATILQEKNILSLIEDKFCSKGRILIQSRPEKFGGKPENIMDFLDDVGEEYDYFLVLDADSLMTGSTVCSLVRLMEHAPTVGIIQAPLQVIGARTLFAQLAQFGARLVQPISYEGLAAWTEGDATYWGHNALIRLPVFRRSCRLPVLAGRPPFGGRVLSHDFVEAALMRRAGFLVRISPRLRGSYEEVPPTLYDYLLRDQRWCRGNLQFARLAFVRGLHWESRWHLIHGFLKFFSAPLWLFATVTLTALHAKSGALPSESISEKFFVSSACMLLLLYAPIMASRFLAILFFEIAADKSQSSIERKGFYWRAFIEFIFAIAMASFRIVAHAAFLIEALTSGDQSWRRQARERGQEYTLGAFVCSLLLSAALLSTAIAVSNHYLGFSSVILLPILCSGLLFPFQQLTASERYRFMPRSRRKSTYIEEADASELLLRVYALRMLFDRYLAENLYRPH